MLGHYVTNYFPKTNVSSSLIKKIGQSQNHVSCHIHRNHMPSITICQTLACCILARGGRGRAHERQKGRGSQRYCLFVKRGVSFLTARRWKPEFISSVSCVLLSSSSGAADGRPERDEMTLQDSLEGSINISSQLHLLTHKQTNNRSDCIWNFPAAPLFL